MKQAIAAVREYQAKYENHTLGLHLEGPYLNVAKKGIHNIEYIRRSDDEMVKHICENADVVTKVTLAPELAPEAHISQLLKRYCGFCRSHQCNLR